MAVFEENMNDWMAAVCDVAKYAKEHDEMMRQRYGDRRFTCPITLNMHNALKRLEIENDRMSLTEQNDETHSR